MSIIILLVSFIFLFLSYGIWSNSHRNKKEILIGTVLVFSTVIVFITELLSLVHQLNFQSILTFWTLFATLNFVYLYRNRTKTLNFINITFLKVKTAIHHLSKFEFSLLVSSGVLLLLIFIQGLLYPPNNVDSLAYHLARVANWISHQSVEHYPTHTFRQIYQPPFSEFIILHVNLLNGGDYFSNAVQFFYLLFAVVAIVSIIQLLGLNRQYQFIGAVLCITIPEVILQASSTQNDLVVSFFILSFVHSAIKAVKEPTLVNYNFAGLSAGIAILTKGTAYIFMTPLVLIFCVYFLATLFRTKKYAMTSFSLAAFSFFVTINAGHYIRNYQLDKNFLGTDDNESGLYKNEKMSAALLLSGIAKNAGNHLGPAPLSQLSNNAIRKLHRFAGMDIDDPGNNIFRFRYTGAPYFPFHEDDSPNIMHFTLIGACFVLLGRHMLKNKKGHGFAALFTIAIILQIILFCWYLKWQPWHSRLHTPLFMLTLPVVCHTLSLNAKYTKLFYITIPFIIIYSYIIVFFNTTRPLISCKLTNPISIQDARYKQYFVNVPERYTEYKVISEDLDKSGFKNIGLILGNYRDMKDEIEYVLFSDIYTKHTHPIHINVFNNPTKTIPVSHIQLDCIISTTNNDSALNYKGKYFYNSTGKNKNIWLYK